MHIPANKSTKIPYECGLTGEERKMHVLQPRHTILKKPEVEKLLTDLNISLTQLPKIKIDDAALPEGSSVGDVIKIERKEEDKTNIFYRIVVI